MRYSELPLAEGDAARAEVCERHLRGECTGCGRLDAPPRLPIFVRREQSRPAPVQTPAVPAEPPLVRKGVRGVLVALMMLQLSACVVRHETTNEPLDAVAVDGLEAGTTTAKEVVERLGAPTDVVQLGRRSAYRYDFTNRKEAGLLLLVVNLFNTDTRSDRVWLFFDENQLLTHHGATFSGDDAQYALPFQDVHQ